MERDSSGPGGASDGNAYENLAARSRRSGDYTIGGGAPAAWSAPRADGAMRTRLREEMELIVEGDSEKLRTGGQGMKLAKFVKFREEKFGAVLFETRSEKVYTLNPTGAAVVRELVAGGEDDVLGRLKDRFDDPTGTLEAEARSFIEDLKAKGLLTQ